MSMLVDYDSHMYRKSFKLWLALMHATKALGRPVTGVTIKDVADVDAAFADACKGDVISCSGDEVQKTAIVAAQIPGRTLVVADPIPTRIEFSRNHDGDVLILENGKVKCLAKTCDGWERAVAYGLIGLPELAEALNKPIVKTRIGLEDFGLLGDTSPTGGEQAIETFGTLGGPK